jgi:hypothetical protein
MPRSRRANQQRKRDLEVFSPKRDGMLPGDIVWMYVKQAGKKPKYEEGYVIEEGASGFQCRDCKYYMYVFWCLSVHRRQVQTRDELWLYRENRTWHGGLETNCVHSVKL